MSSSLPDMDSKVLGGESDGELLPPDFSPVRPSKSPDFDPAVVKLEKFGDARETSPPLSKSLSPGPSPPEAPQGPRPGPTDAKDPEENKQQDGPFFRQVENNKYTMRGTHMTYAEIEGLLDLEPLSAAQYPLPEDHVHQELQKHLSKPENASLSWWPRDEGLVFNDHVRLLWYTMPRTLSCLPTQLLSPSAGVQHAGDRALGLAIEPPSPWEPKFMDLMTQPSSFKMFVDKPKLAPLSKRTIVGPGYLRIQSGTFTSGDFHKLLAVIATMHPSLQFTSKSDADWLLRDSIFPILETHSKTSSAWTILAVIRESPGKRRHPFTLSRLITWNS